MTDISKIHNVNVYDDAKSLLGIASEFTLPDIVMITEDHQGLGMIGKLEIPTGSIDKLSAKVKWQAFYPDIYAQGANPFTARKLQMRASVNTHAAGGLIAETPLVVVLTARWKKVPGGAYGAAKQPELESELSVSYMKITHDGVDLVELDVDNNVWKVNGEDILATYRKNLGA